MNIIPDNELLEEAFCNIIPKFGKGYINTIEIWKSMPNPKPKYGTMKRYLRHYSNDGILDKIGLSNGPQYYCWAEWINS